ncbi:MAG: TonB-dependent receptor [Bacteroidales bacterium]|nr:TonB-dependent receptor [Bacteroidales bacterium]
MLGLLRTAPDFNIADHIGTYVAANGSAYANRQRFYRSQIGQSTNPVYSNPLWTIYEQMAPSEVNRFIVNPELTINAAEWLRFIVRGGIDFYQDYRDEFYPIGSSGSARSNGLWTKTGITSKEINFDGLAIITHDLTEDIMFSATLGVNYNDRNRFSNTNTLAPFAVDSRLMTSDLNPDKNATSWSTTETHIRSNRGYSVLTFGLLDQLFLTASLTAEAASTIKGTFFYPSVDVAWQFTDLLNLPALSFGKLRFAWGKVGIQPAPYKFSTLATTGFGAFGGSFMVDSEKGNSNLKPEIKTEWEAGTNMRFFNDRVDLGVTYYQNQTKDILFAVKTNPSSGYTFNYKNAAVIENKGFEIDLSGKVIDKHNLQLSLLANFNNNKNLVVDIAGAETVDIGGTSKAVKGYPMSSFYLPGSLRDENNNFVLTANGFPSVRHKIPCTGRS